MYSVNSFYHVNCLNLSRSHQIQEGRTREEKNFLEVQPLSPPPSSLVVTLSRNFFSNYKLKVIFS